MNRRISVNTGLAVPQSFITKGKQRLKQHVDTVYLNNGEEFEIELYNPTQNKVLAKIEMNGNAIGNGIVLRPGERVFLERYLDEAKKFKFETYQVEGDNNQVQAAIAKNGDVTVKFYEETKPWNTGTLTWTTNPGYITYATYPSTFTVNSGSGGAYYTNTMGTSNLNLTGTSTANFVNSTLTSGTINTSNFQSNTRSLKSVETGRVEKGSSSSQSFTYDNSTFNSYTSWTNWWKIKPQSTKPLVREDLVVYCTECGSKRKKDNHKFCPHCGTKY